MSRINMTITAAVAALFLGGAAMAASLQPAAGDGPQSDTTPAVSSTLTRSAVEAQAATQPPADGEASAHRDLSQRRPVIKKMSPRHATGHRAWHKKMPQG